MPTIPKSPRTISQLIPSQIPDFIQEDYPMFVAFVKAYYEWLETNGAQVWSGKVLATSPTTITLKDTADATIVNAYQDMFIVCLNGPAKGHTKKIRYYDPKTRVVTLYESWDVTNIPPPNTLMEIRDALHPAKLLEYRDADYTIDKFISYLRDEFMYSIPGNILADKRNILKHIKDFYRAKGTENSFRFLFRILFNQEVEFYYPKVDLFRASDARWYVQKVMKITTTDNTFDYLNRKIIGVVSGATAKVESVVQEVIDGGIVTTLTVSNIEGTFIVDPTTGLPEQVKIVYPVNPPAQTELGSVTDLEEPYNELLYEQAYQLLQSLDIIEPGNDYLVGEEITISGGGGLSDATAIITSIFQTYYNGSCQVPPSTFYLEPFFGPNDTVNTTNDFTQDGVCIPGMYFFSDVHSQYTNSDLLNPNQILLSSSETSTDDFFVGDEIALVGGTGIGQKRIIVSYNGTTKIATVDLPFVDIPDGTTKYSITHIRGGIKSVRSTNFGLGFVTTPTVSIASANGHNAILEPVLGLIGTTSGQWTPGRAGGMGEVPTTPDSFPNSNKIIQDSYYWQDFSYDLRFGEIVDRYRDVVKKLVHPAGMKMFGSVLIKSKPENNFLNLVRRNILWLDAKICDARLTLSKTQELKIIPNDPLVLGFRNVHGSLDRQKFVGFPLTVVGGEVYGNTQIVHFKDRIIGSIVNNPDQRSKLNIDAIVSFESANYTSVVGPIVVDTSQYYAKFVNGTIPHEGNQVRYDFLEGASTSRVYNVSPIILTPVNDVDGRDYDGRNYGGSWVTEGLYFDGSSHIDGTAAGVWNFNPYNNPLYTAPYVNNWAPSLPVRHDTYAIPVNLQECSVIVVAATPDVSQNMSIVNCIQTDQDNGFSIDVLGDANYGPGGLAFRVQNCDTGNTLTKTIVFPSDTLKDDTFFMAVFRFRNGLINCNVNNSETHVARFQSYPIIPANTSSGWYMCKSTNDYIFEPQLPSNFSEQKFGAGKFMQEAIPGATFAIGNFNGTLAYALFYDRALFDYEVKSIYKALREMLLAERNVIIHDTYNRELKGKTRIQVEEIQKTISGTTKFSHRIAQTQLGVTWINNQRRQYESGVSAIQQTTTRTLLGKSNLRITTVAQQFGDARVTGSSLQIVSGLSRMQNSSARTRSGVTRLQNTTIQTMLGVSELTHRISQTQSGVSAIQNTATVTNIGVSSLAGETAQIQTGVAAIQNSGTKTQNGKAAIQNTSTSAQTGLTAVQITSQQTQEGIGSVVVGRTEITQTGDGRIEVTATQDMTGVMNIT